MTVKAFGSLRFSFRSWQTSYQVDKHQYPCRFFLGKPAYDVRNTELFRLMKMLRDLINADGILHDQRYSFGKLLEQAFVGKVCKVVDRTPHARPPIQFQ